MSHAPICRRDDSVATAAEAVRAYQDALQADADHQVVCRECPACPDGDGLESERRRAYREAKLAVTVLGYRSITGYLDASRTAMSMATPP